MRHPDRDPSRRWAVVTPVYEDRESFRELCRRLAGLDLAPALFVVAVDDGSLRDPPRADDITDAGLEGEVLRLARNTGHQGAIAAGLAHVATRPNVDGCVVMDCDGEDDPAVVPALIAEAIRPGFDVAVAMRARRSESVGFKAGYVLFRRVFRLLTGQAIRFGNFMAMPARSVGILARMHETSIHVAATVVKARLRRVEIPTARATRFHGSSRMNLVSLVLHGMRAVIVYSDAVLTRMTMLFGLIAAAAVSAIGIAAVLKLAGLATPGWLTIVTGVSLVLFFQTGLVTLVALLLAGMAQGASPRATLRRSLEFIFAVEPAKRVARESAERSAGEEPRAVQPAPPVAPPEIRKIA
jgi:hypothetical protein